MIILIPDTFPVELLTQDPCRNLHQKRQNFLDPFLLILSGHFLSSLLPFFLDVLIDLLRDLLFYFFLGIQNRLTLHGFDLLQRELVCSHAT